MSQFIIDLAAVVIGVLLALTMLVEIAKKPDSPQNKGNAANE